MPELDADFSSVTYDHAKMLKIPMDIVLMQHQRIGAPLVLLNQNAHIDHLEWTEFLQHH